MPIASDLTIVYYTGNREKPGFEAKIQAALVESSRGAVPIISVSQKPIDFGDNVCVGEVGFSAQNLFRQMQIGIAAAKTRYICPAESDILYPPEYFTFRPPRDDTYYLASPLYVLFAQRGHGKTYCLKPRGSESSMMVARDLVLRRLDVILKDLPQWGNQDADGEKLHFMLERRFARKDIFTLPAAVVTFKTDENLHRKTPHDVNSKVRELPHWGSAVEMLRKYCA